MVGDPRICLFLLLAQRCILLTLLSFRSGMLSGYRQRPQNDTTTMGASYLTQSRQRRRRRRLRARRRLQQTLLRASLNNAATMIIEGFEAGLMSNQRLVWRLDRPGIWWENAWASFSNAQWKENFRMSRLTFNRLVDELREDIEKENIRGPVIPVEKRVAITLWRLGTPNAFRCVSQLFGVGRSTAWVITHDVCKAIGRILPRHLRFPSGAYLQEVKQGFVDMGMPQAVGAIDGTHIPIKGPPENKNDYFNRKGFFSVIMQAVVDHKCRFTDINIGWPGCVHDARVLSNSSLYQKAEAGVLLPEERQLLAGVEVPLFIIGDAAYPLRSWLMKGFPETGRLTPHQVNFNYLLSRARMVVERAFGLLKTRWRCLSRVNESKVENMTHLIAACCVLHNICQNANELDNADIEDEQLVGQLEQNHQQQPQQQPPNHQVEATPLQYRDALMRFLAE